MSLLLHAGKRAVTGLLCLYLLGCATPPQSAALLQQLRAPEQQPVERTRVVLDDVPFFAQDAYQCGPAALATVLVASGLAVEPDALVPLVYVPERKGSFQVELVAAARSHGRLAYTLQPRLESLLAEVRDGSPVLVLQNLGLAAYPKWHYAVVKGYDLARRQVVLNSGLREDYTVSLGTFERTWARGGHWGMVVLEPGAMPVTAEALGYFNAVVALEMAGFPGEARRAYESGLARWPNDRNLLMAYGNLLYGAGELQAAAASFKAATQYHPGYAPAHNNLAQLLFELGELDAALASARTALALGGDYSATYQETLQLISAAAPPALVR